MLLDGVNHVYERLEHHEEDLKFSPFLEDEDTEHTIHTETKVLIEMLYRLHAPGQSRLDIILEALSGVASFHSLAHAFKALEAAQEEDPDGSFGPLELEDHPF
jgi:hypothetical protein